MVLKRFYRVASAERTGAGITVVLDGRPVRTPLRKPLHLPTQTLAAAIAAEWEAQGETIEPATMPMTQFASTAIDRVMDRREAVIDEVAAYGDTDLLCYRADGPAELVARQAKTWQPLLDWAAMRFGIALAATEGVIAIEQPSEALATLRGVLAERDAFGLAGLHNLTTGLGSVVLALAVEQQEIDPEAAWQASILDEIWQAEQWGRDEEAENRRAALRDNVLSAAHFLSLLRG